MAKRVQRRRGTTAELAAGLDPAPLAGELLIDMDKGVPVVAVDAETLVPAAAETHTHTLADVTDAGTAAAEDVEAFAAASHAHAAADVTSGTLAHERGGLEADVSAYAGLVKISGGATSAVASTAAGEAMVTAADADAQTALLSDVVGDAGAGGTKGLVPAPGAGDAAAAKFLKADATWATPAGGGDVSGPGASTDHAIARWDSTGGDTLLNSTNATVDDDGDMNIASVTAIPNADAPSGTFRAHATATPATSIVLQTQESDNDPLFRTYADGHTNIPTGQEYQVNGAQHTHAAANITSGTLVHERGGLEADVSAYSGLVKITGGATSAVTVTAAGEALLDDTDAATMRATLGIATAEAPGDDSFLVGESSVYANKTLAETKTILGVDAATSTATGVVELAIASEVTTGTDSDRAVTPDALAGSAYGKRAVMVQVTADATDVTTSDVAYFRAPSFLNGMNLVRVGADVTTAGTTNATTIQVRNMTAHASNDALSAPASIASTEVLATDGTVDTTYDSCATNDLWRITVTGVSTTAPKGLRVVCEFQTP